MRPSIAHCRPLLVLIMAITLPATWAQAVIIANDNFSYSAGDLHGQNGGTGWSDAWDADASSTETVVSTGLSYGITGGGTVGGDGSGALQIGAGGFGELAFRLLPSQSGNAVFFRALVKLSAGTFETSGSPDALLFWFDNAIAGGTHSTNIPNIGLLSDSNNDYAVRLNSSTVARLGGHVDNDMHLIVGKLYKTAPGPTGYYNRFSMWLDPLAGDEAAPDATATTTSNYLQNFQYLGIRSNSLDTGDAFIIDEILLADSFSDVVPLPEPATLAMMLLGGLATIRRRR